MLINGEMEILWESKGVDLGMWEVREESLLGLAYKRNLEEEEEG